MKRRNFIGALASAIGISPAIYGKDTHHVATVEIDHEKIFREIFFKLYGFPPNSLQLIMFNQYRNGCKSRVQPRQIGMTTFMLALTAYETKVNRKNVCLITNRSSLERYHDFSHIMNDKLGKSIHDGRLNFCASVKGTRGSSSDIIFQENPWILYRDEYSWPIPIINFTTTDNYLLGYKGK